ncbi:hypothetical protein [Burkholderia diffusa]|uniref:hypothetical protein n=2 Tax=Burkholderia diffusa TaxID=488732 RepID=UPI001244B60F|nr:hypothetical protein [Burkholderia diffusa]
MRSMWEGNVPTKPSVAVFDTGRAVGRKGRAERLNRKISALRQTPQIRSPAKITQDDSVLVDQMTTKYSRFEHSKCDEFDATLPGVDELADDPKLMIDWIGEFDKRAVA